MITSNNGNGNSDGMGTGTGTMGRLLRLRDQRAQELAALDTTIALLNGAAAATKRGRAASVLDAAIELDAERRGKRGPYGKRKKKMDKASVQERRARSAAFLNQFDREKPKRVPNARRIAPLLLHGYLKKKGDGYVRTAREFSVEKH
jgi:hypothetical protein